MLCELYISQLREGKGWGRLAEEAGTEAVGKCGCNSRSESDYTVLQRPEPHRALWEKAETLLGLHFRKTLLAPSGETFLQVTSLLTKASPSSCHRWPFLSP